MGSACATGAGSPRNAVGTQRAAFLQWTVSRRAVMIANAIAECHESPYAREIDETACQHCVRKNPDG